MGADAEDELDIPFWLDTAIEFLRTHSAAALATMKDTEVKRKLLLYIREGEVAAAREYVTAVLNHAVAQCKTTFNLNSDGEMLVLAALREGLAHKAITHFKAINVITFIPAAVPKSILGRATPQAAGGGRGDGGGRGPDGGGRGGGYGRGGWGGRGGMRGFDGGAAGAGGGFPWAGAQLPAGGAIEDGGWYPTRAGRGYPQGGRGGRGFGFGGRGYQSSGEGGYGPATSYPLPAPTGTGIFSRQQQQQQGFRGGRPQTGGW